MLQRGQCGRAARTGRVRAQHSRLARAECGRLWAPRLGPHPGPGLQPQWRLPGSAATAAAGWSNCFEPCNQNHHSAGTWPSASPTKLMEYPVLSRAAGTGHLGLSLCSYMGCYGGISNHFKLWSIRRMANESGNFAKHFQPEHTI